MGLKSLKWEFESLTGLAGTAANARAFLVSIQLSPYGYDFRTIASWEECVWSIETRLNEIKEAEATAEAAKSSPHKEDEITELEKQIIEKYNTLSLSWFLIKKFHGIRFKKDLKRLRKIISLWVHPDINKDKKATKYMAIFNDILDTLKTKVAN